jgi:Amt family ammonium transporter
LLAGGVPYLACTKLKAIFKYDDALDTFGVHGVGGTLGCILAGVFADPAVNPNLATNLGAKISDNVLVIEQLKAAGVTLALSIGGTAVIAYAIKAVLGLRPSVEGEETGLDDADHGEAGWHLDEGGGHGGLEASPIGSLAMTAPAEEPEPEAA